MYDTKKQLTQNDFEEGILSFSTKNAMTDDSPVFSLVLVAKYKWDQILNSNDLVRIKVTPDRTKAEPENPYIMVGLISDIRQDGEYADGTLIYRITGRAMTKALIDFEVGVIQEVSTILDSVGWLPDSDRGLSFSGKTAAEIGKALVDKFIFQYAQYNFAGNKSLPDFLETHFTSWAEYESLADVTPFINYEGSIRQFLEDVSAKPFNELFFEFTSEGVCAAIMRPTPFDYDKWIQLPTSKFTSDVVVEESFGKSDAEMYSIFVVQAPNLLELTSVDLGVFPKFHPDLVNKYGYKRLDAQYRYLLSSNVAMSTSPDTETAGAVNPTYEQVLVFIQENNYQDPEILRTQSNTIYAELLSQFPVLSSAKIDKIIDALKDGGFVRERYSEILLEADDSSNSAEVSKERNAAVDKLELFTQKLFNWYCENVNFYNGDLRVLGNPTYQVGTKLEYQDFERQNTWEFYLESVQHEFSFTNGYTTVLGVTRGLPNKGVNRFRNLWGKSEDFKGGYLGEMSLEEAITAGNQAGNTGSPNASGEWGSGTGSGGSMGALQTAQAMLSRQSVYVFGGGRTGSNPFLSNPIRVDCSSFVWWCFHLNGVSLKGGKTGMATDTIASDPQLRTISQRGSSKEYAKGLLQIGDLVYFDTYKQNGHIGIYSGNGKFIGAQSSSAISEENMASGYWWQKFNGHIRRYER